ncbi:MAG: tetratricopeptide repeat protein [candidate division Zixibacteria bacterium]|nr:tetratricopeptide repeat protein [candidate division Zixibacteria bacterium]
MKNIRLFILCLCFLTAAMGASDDGGTRSPFSLGTGSRDLSMGGANIADCSPSTAVFWNPARLATAETYSFSGFHTSLFDADASLQYFGLAIPTLDYGSFGFGVFHLGINNIERTDAGNLSLGTFSDSRIGIYLAYARVISDYQLGVSIVMEHHSLDTYKASSTPGLNVSVTRKINFNGRKLSFISINAGARNLIRPGFKLVNATAKYPIGAEFGVTCGLNTFKSWNQQVILAVNANKFDYVAPSFNFGVEYSFDSILFLRAGLRKSNPSAGLGVSYRGFTFDYALLDRDLGSLHTLTLSTSFGSTISTKRQLRAQARENEFQSLMQQQMSQRNLDLIHQLVDDGTNLLETGEIVEAANSFDRALFLARSSNTDTTQIAGLVNQTRERLDNLMRLKNYNEYMDSASIKLGSGDYATAKYFAGIALNEMPNSTDARILLQQIDTELNRIYTAEEQLQQQLLVADSLISYGRSREALIILEELRRLSPDNLAVQTISKKAYFEQWRASAADEYDSQNFRKALNAIDSALVIYPGHHWCLQMKSQINTRVAQQTRAKGKTIAKRQQPIGDKMLKEIKQLYDSGQEYFRNGDLVAAIQNWERVENLAPGYQSIREYLVNAYKYVGVDLYGNNKLSDAVIVWQKAAQLDPENYEISDYIQRTEAEIKKLQELSYEAR